jgi:DNA polymerase-3 subunit gamma/tau
MTHKALAVKFRPQTFGEIVGQGPVVKTLQNALRTGRLHPAYIFSGIRGVGKTTIARIVAKGINCRGADGQAKFPTPDPCGICDSCIEIRDCRSMDVLEIDGASNNKVEEARDLTQLARYTPARDRFRVFIIDEVHMLSTAAFNALLKTLEEPPPHVIFLLATTEPRKIPETIQSRAQHFEFRKVAAAVIAAHLAGVCEREGLLAEPAALELVSRAGDGSVRDSLTLLDRLSSYADGPISEADAAEVLGLAGREVLFHATEAVAASDARALLDLLGEVLARGRDTKRFLEDLAGHVRRLLRERLAASAPPAGEPEETTARFAAQASRFSPEDLLRLQDLLLTTLQRLKDAPDPDALLELQLMKAAYLPKILPLEAILSGAQLPQAPAQPPQPLRAVPAPTPQPAPPPPPDADSPAPHGAGLRFTSLTAFQRMDGEEARSFEEDDERLARVRKRFAQAVPLAQGALEKANLSVDPEGVLHIALPPSASAGLALLGTPDRKRILDEAARAEGFPGGAALEKKEGGEEESVVPAPKAPEAKGEFASKAVDSVRRVFGAQLIEVRRAPEPAVEKSHDEPE